VAVSVVVTNDQPRCPPSGLGADRVGTAWNGSRGISVLTRHRRATRHMARTDFDGDQIPWAHSLGWWGWSDSRLQQRRYAKYIILTAWVDALLCWKVEARPCNG